MVIKLLGLVLWGKLLMMFLNETGSRDVIWIGLIVMRSKRRKGRPMRWRIPWWRPLIQERRPVAVTSDGLLRVPEEVEDLVIVSHRRSGDIVHVSPPELVGVLVAGVGIVSVHLRLNVRVRAAT